MAEQLVHKGIEVTIIQRGNQVMKQMDADMAYRVQKELEKNHVKLQLNTTITKVIEKDGYITELATNQEQTIKSDLVILAAGVTRILHLFNRQLFNWENLVRLK